MARTTPVNTGYTIINGSGTGSNGNRIDVWAEYKITAQNAIDNSSTLAVYFYAALNSAYTSTTQLTSGLNSALQVDGKAGSGVSNGGYDFTQAGQPNFLGQFNGKVFHNADGSKTVRISGSFTTKSTYISGGTLSADIKLPAIARASSLGATDAAIGKTAMIAISPKNSSYTHSLSYQFGSRKGYIDGDGQVADQPVIFGNTAVAFLVPDSFYDEIPNASTGTCQLSCTTYSGATQIGTVQSAKFTVRVEDAAPLVSGSVEDCDPVTLALTGDPKTLIRYHSMVLCQVSAQGQKGATIVEKTVDGVAIEDESMPMVCTGKTITLGAKDSRGLQTQITADCTVIDYQHLTANGSVQRPDPTATTATVQLSGSFFQGMLGQTPNQLQVSYRLNDREQQDAQAEIQSQNGKYTATFSLEDLDYTQAHSLTVTVSDLLETVSRQLTIHKGIPVFDWGEGDFRFHVPVICHGGINGIYSKAYRVWGSDRLTIQSRYSGIGETGNRQSVFLFGNANHETVMGVITIRSDGVTAWSGTDGVAVSSMDEQGRVEVTLPQISYDYLTALSANYIA